MSRLLHIAFRPAAAILAAILMACQCAEPVPPAPPTPPEPPAEDISEDLKAFLLKSETGLYIDAEDIIVFDELSFQKAWNADNRSFRIQRDEQREYLSISSSSPSTSSSYQVEYMYGTHGVTLLLLKLQSVKTQGSNVWLWNETMKTGIIVPEGMI
jgi:hypothetical protein